MYLRNVIQKNNTHDYQKMTRNCKIKCLKLKTRQLKTNHQNATISPASAHNFSNPGPCPSRPREFREAPRKNHPSRNSDESAEGAGKTTAGVNAVHYEHSKVSEYSPGV